MKNVSKVLGLALLSGTVFFTSCKDKTPKPTTQTFTELEQATLTDFVNVVGNPLYAKFEALAGELKTAVQNLSSNPTPANLATARTAWKNVRVIWEQSEGFLIGPVDDLNYDPYMDTWPTDHNAMDNLLSSTTPITVSYLAGLDDPEDATELTLRGFHPLEYLLWGLGGNRDASTISAREKEYMVALASDIYNNVSALKASWLPGSIYFGNKLITPGSGNDLYTNKKEALEALANALIDICSEVAGGKMLEPYEPNPDSTITESPYAHNSIADFKNNIIGARNVYTCTFNGATGKSLSDLVGFNNKTLDLEIKQKFEVAINSFDGFTTTFESAIYNQRTQVQNTLNALNALKTSLDDKLIPYIRQYVKD
ncbi:imelysin family protein [Taibaiella sp. KBW10]|uniref:imelysin family protein n=1 Tax=Taibaiella sp. KBW10 TaxID=2153357 RepID=UPI001F296B7B|nr:imelysin family protein [Taibaiella sp. KBW10]